MHDIITNTGYTRYLSCGRVIGNLWKKVGLLDWRNNLNSLWALTRKLLSSVSSVAQSCPTLCKPMNHSMPGLPVHHQLLQFTKTHVHWVSDAIQPSHPLLPLLLLPSIFPSIRVFSNESALRIRWPKYWSFSFKISPINEYPGLIFLFIKVPF